MPLISLLLLLIQLVALVAGVVALVDAARRKAAVFPAAGKQTKNLWIAILAAGVLLLLVFGPISLLGLPAIVATIVYFVDVKPAVSETSGGGPYGGW